MLEFNEPKPILLKHPNAPTVEARAYTLRDYLLEIILAQPYYRDVGMDEGVEILDAIDAIDQGSSARYILRNETVENLQKQMKLVDSQIVQLNAILVRPSIRFSRVVKNAKKHEEDEVKPTP